MMKIKVEEITEVGEVVQTRSVEIDWHAFDREIIKAMFKAMEEE
jgi:hypothetical protein